MTQRDNIDIVNADSTHIPRIAELERKYIPGGWSENALLNTINDPRFITLVAVWGDIVTGFLNGSYVLDEGELLNIAVDEKYRRRGIAGILLNEFEKRLKSFGVDRIFLEVREGNTGAIRLYEKHDYKKNGLRKNYYRNPDENAVLLLHQFGKV